MKASLILGHEDDAPASPTKLRCYYQSAPPHSHEAEGKAVGFWKRVGYVHDEWIRRARKVTSDRPSTSLASLSGSAVRPGEVQAICVEVTLWRHTADRGTR